jgi:PH domain/leucine-rich repeat-containing protein phosphatase
MSENSIEYLDLSALDKIESVQCCMNQIKELTLNGRVLNSLVASNNSKSKN